jgi:cytidylate kinase
MGAELARRVNMIITIDGPAGAGKSTAARMLARRLGFEFLDTGAMYRAVALSALRAGIELRDEQALSRFVCGVSLEMHPDQVLLDGVDVSVAIRSQAVSEAASLVATSPSVREHLVRLQRIIATGRSIVCEGRDQGTVVFPDATCKFFLIADAEERARRRQRDLAVRGAAIDPAALVETIRRRDRQDATRAVGPMKSADDAIVIDSTCLSSEQVVERMEAVVLSRRSPA